VAERRSMVLSSRTGITVRIWKEKENMTNGRMGRGKSGQEERRCRSARRALAQQDEMRVLQRASAGEVERTWRLSTRASLLPYRTWCRTPLARLRI
jgi:hypothetical protein